MTQCHIHYSVMYAARQNVWLTLYSFMLVVLGVLSSTFLGQSKKLNRGVSVICHHHQSEFIQRYMTCQKGIRPSRLFIYVSASNVYAAHISVNEVVLTRATWTERHYSLQITVSQSRRDNDTFACQGHCPVTVLC